MLLPVIVIDMPIIQPAAEIRMGQPANQSMLVSALVADNVPENVYAIVQGPNDAVLATVYKTGIVATSNEISARMAAEFEKTDDPEARAQAIARAFGGTVVHRESQK